MTRKESTLKWRNKNKEKYSKWVRVYNREYYRANKEKIKARTKKWDSVNLEKSRTRHSRKRARQQQAEGYFSSEDIQKIYNDQNGKCFYCKKDLNNIFDIEHKIPLIRGGSNWSDNLCCSCKSCNNSKHSKTAEEFLAIITDLSGGKNHSND